MGRMGFRSRFRNPSPYLLPPSHVPQNGLELLEFSYHHLVHRLAVRRYQLADSTVVCDWIFLAVLFEEV